MSQGTLIPGMLLLLSGSAFAEDQKKLSYQDLLGQVKKTDPKADFTALRMTYTQTKDYNPYGGDRATRDAMRRAFGKKDYQESIKQADKLLEKNFVDIEAHRLAASAHAELKNDEKAKFHTYMRDGLLKSILKSGDGKSPGTAFVVIVTSEEYAVMDSMGIKPMQQALTQDNGHKFDRQDGEDNKKQPITLYFNIDRPFQWLTDSFKKKD